MRWLRRGWLVTGGLSDVDVEIVGAGCLLARAAATRCRGLRPSSGDHRSRDGD